MLSQSPRASATSAATFKGRASRASHTASPRLGFLIRLEVDDEPVNNPSTWFVRPLDQAAFFGGESREAVLLRCETWMSNLSKLSRHDGAARTADIINDPDCRGSASRHIKGFEDMPVCDEIIATSSANGLKAKRVLGEDLSKRYDKCCFCFKEQQQSKRCSKCHRAVYCR